MSNLSSFGWNAVVAGRWNPAILNPKGIAKLIFKKEDNDPINVLVPLDTMEPYKVKIDNFLISANFDKLVIDCEKPEWDSLEKAMKYCETGLDELPKTPLIASGFNVRYELKTPNDDFIDILKVPLDDKLGDNGLIIERREIRRSIKWKEGLINIHIVMSDISSYQVLLNFDKQSNDKDELKNWLSISINDVKDIVDKILFSVLNIEKEDE